MVIKTIITAYKENGEFIDTYEYDRPLDKIGSECVELWMDLTNWCHPCCTFAVHNIKDKVGFKFKLPICLCDGDLFSC